MDLLQVKAAMIACRRAMKSAGRTVPLQVQVTMETTGRMLVGSEIGAALVSLGAMRPDVLGINCATGPAEMQEHLRFLVQHSPLPISVLPNAGLPSVVDGRTHYDLTPAELADITVATSANSACRSSAGAAERRRSTSGKSSRRSAASTPARRSPSLEPSVSSIYSPVALAQDLSVLMIGERTNANGSKAFRDAMLDGDWDNCVKMANEQIKEGAHVLDVCVDYVGRDGTLDMDEIAGASPPSRASARHRLHRTAGARGGAAPIGGRAILNSANLEDGELPGSRMDRVFSLPRLRGGGDLSAHRRARPSARCRVEDGGRPSHHRDRHGALRTAAERFDLRRPDVPPVHRRRRLGDAIATIEAIRGTR